MPTKKLEAKFYSEEKELIKLVNNPHFDKSNRDHTFTMQVIYNNMVEIKKELKRRGVVVKLATEESYNILTEMNLINKK